MRNVIAKLVVLVASVMLLNSCWFPERFKADLHLGADGTYLMTCEAMMVVVGQKTEDVKPKAEEASREIMKENPDYKKVTYAGSNRYAVSYRTEGRLEVNKPVELFNMDSSYPLITLRLYPDGELEVLGYRVAEETVENLKKDNLVMLEGLITITTEGEVAFSNSKQREGNSHVWKLRSIKDRMPAMYIKTERR